MKKIIVIISLLCIYIALVNGEQLTQTVRGTVIDNDSKLPIIGAHVILVNGEQLNATTDEKGNFRFSNVSVGRINLQITYIGYEAKSIPDIVINSGKEMVLNVSLSEAIVKLDEVVIKTNKNKGEAVNEMSMLSARSISINETQRYTGGMNDPSRVVSSFAGVASTPDGSSDIIVRGNSPKYMQWRIDGNEITSPYHMDDQNASFGALTALNNNLLATSDFYTGAFSAEYGNVLSSVFDLKLRTGNNEKFEAACAIGILGTDVTFEGPFKKGYAGSFLVNYRYSTISLIKKLGLVDVPGIVDYQDITCKLVLPTLNAGTFSIYGLGGLSGFDMDKMNVEGLSSPGKPTNANILRDYTKSSMLANAGINHTYSFNTRSHIKSSLSVAANGFNDDIFELNVIKKFNNMGEYIGDSTLNRQPTFYSKVSKTAYRFTSTYNYKINAKNKIQFGTKYTLWEYSYFQNTLNQFNVFTNATNTNKTANTISNFVNWKHNLTNNITLVAGLHNMNVLLNNKSTLEPRVALNFKINNTSSVFAGYGNHSTMESVHNYFTKIYLANGSVTEPNRNLDLLRANHYVLGYEKYFSENLKAKIEMYYQQLYNLPVENNDTSYYATINESYDYRYVPLVNKGVGKNYGVEITIERFFANSYYFLINTSIFDSKYKTLEGIWRNTQYNGNWIGNILIGKEFKNLGAKQNKTLSLNLKAFMAGGKKYIPLLRDAQNNIAVDPLNNKYWDYKKAYENKIDDIFQINFSVSYKINKPNSTREWFLDLINLSNAQARVNEYFDASKPNKIGYSRSFGIFPNLMYRIYF